jgi:hypothetical protein
MCAEFRISGQEEATKEKRLGGSNGSKNDQNKDVRTYEIKN